MQGKAYPALPTLHCLPCTYPVPSGSGGKGKRNTWAGCWQAWGRAGAEKPGAGGGWCVVGNVCRESIFWISHTNEFCGKSKVANECRVAGASHQRARRVCESGWPVEKSAGHNTTAIKQLYHILKTFIAWSLEQACRLRSR